MVELYNLLNKKNEMVNVDDIDVIYEMYYNQKYETHVDNVKKILSQIKKYFILYDIYINNIVIIENDENTFSEIVKKNYRCPNNTVINLMNALKEEYEINKLDDHRKELINKKIHKINLSIWFISNFDIDIIKKRYVDMIFNNIEDIKDLNNVCIKPSFNIDLYMYGMKHIEPYYKYSELINMAKNLNIPNSNNMCEIISHNDINFFCIIRHYKYIYHENIVNLLRYYTLQGSYFINKYMRFLESNNQLKNEYLENIVAKISNMINNSPSFDNDYTVYRFINDDNYMDHLKVGDLYKDNGFLSSTRDPFYKNNIYHFGFILIKIHIPKDIKGVALMLETISYFSDEQEIIFSPTSIFKLINKNNNVLYYHTDKKYQYKIKKMYEFEWMSNKGHILNPDPPFPFHSIIPLAQSIDFLKIDKCGINLSLDEHINFFIDKYVNSIYQFNVKIGNKLFNASLEWYDSSDIYKNMYAIKTTKGLSISSIYDNNVIFMIEIGEIDGISHMYVNFFNKFNYKKMNLYYNDIDFLTFISSIAYYFNIYHTILFCEYMEVHSNEEDYILNGNYCVDFYDYIVNGNKKYGNIPELKPIFEYSKFDRMKTLKPYYEDDDLSNNYDRILNKFDKDDLYQIYRKNYKSYILENNQFKENITDFYIYIINFYPHLINLFIDKINILYGDNKNNPFMKDYYKLNSYEFLYNRYLIHYFPIIDIYKNDIDKQYTLRPKNRYRKN